MIEGFDDYPPDSVAGVAYSQDREALLRVLRGKLAERVDSFPEEGRETDFVALVRQLQAVAAELAELGAEGTETELEAARRRLRESRGGVDDRTGGRYRRRGA